MKYLITTLKNHKPHSYTLNAKSLHQAKTLAFQKDRQIPLSIHIAPPLFKLPIPSKHLILFSQQMQLMTQAKIPIDTALGLALKHCKHQHVAFILDGVLQNLHNGLTLAQSVLPFQPSLGNLTIKLIEVSARSQNLAEGFSLIASVLQSKEQNRRKIKKALTYPLFILIAMIFAMIGLFHFLIPQLLVLFSQHTQELPLATRILIGLHHFFQIYGIFILTLMAILGFLSSYFYKKRQAFFRYTQTLLFSLPLLRNVLKTYYCYEYFLSLSMLLKCKIPLDEAMEFAKQSTQSHFFQNRLELASQELQSGKSLSLSLQKSQMFDSLLLSLLEISQKSGNIQEVLELCTSHYKQKLEDLTQQSIVLIEPILTLIMGLCVLFLALAIFMPLQNLNNVF